MSKYVLEEEKKKHLYIAWISFFMLVLNVFHTRLMIIFSLYNQGSTIIIQCFAIIAMIIYLMGDRGLEFKSMRIGALDVLLLLSFAIIIITTKNLQANATYIIRYIAYILLVIMMKYDEKLAHIAFWCILVATLLHVIFTIWFYYDVDFYLAYILPTFDPAQREHLYSHVVYKGYATGMATHYSLSGIYMSVALCCVQTLFYMEKEKKKKILFSLLFILVLIVLFMTGKRGVLVFALLAVITTYLICGKTAMGNKFVVTIFVVAISFAVLYIASFYIESIASTFMRLNETIFADEATDISSGRFRLYEIAWGFFREKPLVGIGWREFMNEVVMYYNTNEQVYDAHNVFLQLLCETGIFGFCVFVALFVTAYVMTIKYVIAIKKNEINVSSTLAAILNFSLCFQTFFLLYCLAGNPLYDNLTLFTYLISVAICGFVDSEYRVIKKKSEKKEFSKYII